MERRPGDGRPMSTSPGATCSPVMSWSRSATPTAKPTRSNSPGLHGAGVLGHLAADQRAAGLAAALGHALDQLLDVVGVELADRDVVEEEQRLGALAHEVVDAHGHEVDADGVEPAGGLGDQRLGADAVGGRHQHRVAVAVVGEAEQPAEPADVADDLGPEGGAHLVLDALDGFLAGGDVDARGLVGLTHRVSVLGPVVRGCGSATRDGVVDRGLVDGEEVGLGQLDRHGLAGAAEAVARRRARPW